MHSLNTSQDELPKDDMKWAVNSNYVPPTRRAEVQHTADADLLQRLLGDVSNSIQSFRPSPSLANLSAAGQQEEVDIVVSGGGLKGYFVIGARAVLENQLAQRNLKLCRCAGASAGAWAAMFMASGVSNSDWLKTYTFTRNAFEAGDSSRVLEAYREQILPWLAEKLPKDAYIRCNGRCFISITVLDRCGWLPRNMIVSQFESNEDLVNACFASSCIPFVVEHGMGPRFRGLRVVDGGLTNNTPCFTDGVRRQIVIRLEQVPYDWRAFAIPCDPCIEALALNGALMMARFLEGREVGLAISWSSRGAGQGIFYEMLSPALRRIVDAYWMHRRYRTVAVIALLTVLAIRWRQRLASARGGRSRSALLLSAAAAVAVLRLSRQAAATEAQELQRPLSRSQSGNLHPSDSTASLSLMSSVSVTNLERLM